MSDYVFEQFNVFFLKMFVVSICQFLKSNLTNFESQRAFFSLVFVSFRLVNIIILFMALTSHYYTQFEAELFYHVYNRSIDKKPLFKNDENYRFFLRRYSKYLSPVVTTYSYALCGNHFHLGIKIKTVEELMNFQKLSNRKQIFTTAHQIVAHQFKLFFISYAKAFNKQQDRVGTLFQTPFKRCEVNSNVKLVRMLFYHHSNPQHHRICNDFRLYPWTSYSRYLLDQPSLLSKAEVFEWFGGKRAFIEVHKEVENELNDRENWWIED